MSDVSTYDLNADVGEGFLHDHELLRVITSANVACGFHAGDDNTMRELSRQAAANDVAIGAQVSYRDREGFGRRELEVPYAELVADLDEQVEKLSAIARDSSAAVTYLKPHGALYNRACWDAAQASAIVDVAAARRLPVLTLPGSMLAERAEVGGVPVMREFFADRAYDAHGRLVARTSDGAVISDPAVVASRVHRLVTAGWVTTIGGGRLPVEADSICVHGDTAGAVGLAIAVRAALTQAGVEVARCT